MPDEEELCLSLEDLGRFARAYGRLDHVIDWIVIHAIWNAKLESGAAAIERVMKGYNDG